MALKPGIVVYVLLVGAAISFLLGDAHAVTLKNYTTYNTTNQVTGNITIDVDDFQTEVKDQMGAVALSILAAVFAFLYASIKQEHNQPIRILMLVASLLMAAQTAFVVAEANKKALQSIEITTWVLIVVMGLLGLYIIYNVLMETIRLRRGYTKQKLSKDERNRWDL